MQEQRSETDDSRTDATDDSAAGADGRHHEFHPSMRPATMAIGLTILVTLVLVGFLSVAQPFGPDTNPIAIAVVALFGVILVVRYAVRLVVLGSTTYVVTDTELRREFAMLYRRRSRDLPIHQVRAVDLDVSPLEKLLGYGTLRFLTSGANHGLGYLTFDAAPDAEHHRDVVRDLVTESRDE